MPERSLFELAISAGANVKSIITHDKCIKFLRHKIASKVVSATTFVFVLACSATAQVDRAALNGTVTDPQGRVLPNVSVFAVQEATGLHRQAITSSQGTYEIPELPLGTYSVTFAHVGFHSSLVKNVIEELGSTRTLNAKLQLAAAEEQVSVSASDPLLDQTSDSLGTEVEEKQLSELPLNGRNWAGLMALAAGAVDTGGQQPTQYSICR